MTPGTPAKTSSKSAQLRESLDDGRKRGKSLPTLVTVVVTDALAVVVLILKFGLPYLKRLHFRCPSCRELGALKCISRFGNTPLLRCERCGHNAKRSVSQGSSDVGAYAIEGVPKLGLAVYRFGEFWPSLRNCVIDFGTLAIALNSCF